MTDLELKRHVESALEWEPSVDAADIGVSVDAGVVTLRGMSVATPQGRGRTSDATRLRCESSCERAHGPTVTGFFQRNDTDIAQAAVTALTWNAIIPQNRVTVTVSDGWLTLTDTLDWQYQKEAAARAVRDLVGVKGVTNSITSNRTFNPAT